MNNLASKKEIEGFLGLVKKDEKLQSLVNRVDKELEGTKDGEALVKKEILPVAAEKGFNFTAKDFLDYLNEETKALEKSDAKKVSGDGTQTAGKGKFGGGKIGKLLMLLGGGAAVGTSGVFAINHFRNAQKAKTAQVQNIDANAANSEETSNDGLRPQEQGIQDEEGNKTSDNLKETLKNREGGAENKGANNAAAPSAGANDSGNKGPAPAAGQKSGSTRKSTAQMPKLSDAQIREIDQKLDDLLNNKDGALDQIYNQAKAMDPSIKREDLVKIYRDLRNASPDEKMQFLMESMQAMQQMGGAPAAGKK